MLRNNLWNILLDATKIYSYAQERHKNTQNAWMESAEITEDSKIDTRKICRKARNQSCLYGVY